MFLWVTPTTDWLVGYCIVLMVWLSTIIVCPISSKNFIEYRIQKKLCLRPNLLWLYSKCTHFPNIGWPELVVRCFFLDTWLTMISISCNNIVLTKVTAGLRRQNGITKRKYDDEEPWVERKKEYIVQMLVNKSMNMFIKTVEWMNEWISGFKYNLHCW